MRDEAKENVEDDNYSYVQEAVFHCINEETPYPELSQPFKSGA